MRLRISPAEQRAGRIVHANFHQQSSRGLVDSFSRSDQCSVEDPARKFREHQFSTQSGLRRLRVDLWEADVNQKLVRLNNMKKLSPCPSYAPRLNKSANFRVTCKYLHLEESVYLLESVLYFHN